MSDPSPLAARRGFITLDAEAWAAIRSEYLAGTTAKQVSAKWGCSVVAVYDHASKGGWTKHARGRAISATVLEETRAERAQRAARAAQPPAEADPLLAARMLMRQAAASALLGRGVEAFEGVRLAESLARCARLVAEAEHGIADARGDLMAEARRGLQDDDDYVPAGWRESEEAEALDEGILQGLARIAARRGRTPPQRLPLWCTLEDQPHMRPLAEALGLVAEGRDWVECADFGAALSHAYAAGRGEAVQRALSEPLPLSLCPWLDGAAEDGAAVEAAPSDEGVIKAEWAEAPSVEAGEPLAVDPVQRTTSAAQRDDDLRDRLPRRVCGIGEPARAIT